MSDANAARIMRAAIMSLVASMLIFLVFVWLLFSGAYRTPSPIGDRAAAHCHAVAERIRRDLNEPSDATHRDLAELVAGDEIYVCLGRSITIDQAVDTIDDLRRLP